MHIDNVTTIVTTILDKAEVIVAHAIENEMGYLRYVPWKKYAKKCVDTQQFSTVQRGGGLKLAYLASVYLGRDIQGEEHSSVEDAQATMALYFFLKQKEAKQAEGTTTSVQDSGYSESSTAAASSEAAHLEDSSVPLVPMTEPVTTAPTCLADSNESPSALSGLASIDIEALRAAASRKIAVPYIKALAKGRRFDWRTSTYY